MCTNRTVYRYLASIRCFALLMAMFSGFLFDGRTCTLPEMHNVVVPSSNYPGDHFEEVEWMHRRERVWD